MRADPTDWLLGSDPSIRWQVLRDLLHESDEVVAAERSRVAFEGWGVRYEKAKGVPAAVKEARLRGEEYLLKRDLLRSLSSGEMINPDWTLFSFPTRWHYDVLWGLDYLRRAGVKPDQRVAEAIDLVKKKRGSDGRWALENPHSGKVHFDLEDGAGKPSHWITLRALRVLDWSSRPST